ncbi:hypothetical protein DJ529_03645 [Sulfolobus sp. C3]|nr:hypothetical protein DJ529_03645 [Sulfolobus sp. C3]
MKKIGFSIFPGWKEIKEEQIKLMKIARDYGFSEIFMGIGPGTHWKTPVREAFEIAKELLRGADDYYAFLDINPEILKELNSSPRDLSKFKEAGFKGVRADYGFKKEEIVEMSRQLIVELNPMLVTREELEYITRNADPERVKAIHNYYPVIYSGISREIFHEKNRLLKEKGIEIGAFISTPMFNLRTTLEILRFIEPFDSANYLFKYVDRVLIGDPIPKEEWLIQVQEVARLEGNVVRIKVYREDVIEYLTKNKFRVEDEDREYAIVAITDQQFTLNCKCYTKIFRNSVALRGRDIWIFTRDLDVAPFNLIGEIDDINLEIMKLLRGKLINFRLKEK